MTRFRAVCALVAVAAACGNPVAALDTNPSNTDEWLDRYAGSRELNRSLPGWLRFGGEERVRFEAFSNGGFQPGNDDGYVLQRFRLNMNIQPVAWLKFKFQAQDARVFFKEAKPYAAPFQDTWNLRMAFVELGDFKNDPVTVRVGRQEINLGDERLVGSTNWSNTARTFDAARVRFRRGKLRLDAFASSVVVLKDGDVGEVRPGNNLHGLYGGLEDVLPGATIEPYVLWRLAPRLRSETGAIGNQDMKTAGVRWVGRAARLDYSVEMALQRGSLGPDSISAWAGHWVAGYNWTAGAWKLRYMNEYNYATGDRDPNDGRRNTFDQLYPTAHDKYGLADQVGWKNIHHVRTGLEVQPRAKWSVAVRHNWYWLADAHDALYNTSSTAIARMPDGSAGRYVGHELDAVGAYKFARQLHLGAGLGHLFPGRFLKEASPGRAYTSPYLFVDYLF